MGKFSGSKNKSGNLISSNHICCFFLHAHIYLIIAVIILVIGYNLLSNLGVINPSIKVIRFIKDNTFISYVLSSVFQIVQLGFTFISYLANKLNKSDKVFQKLVKRIFGKEVYYGTFFVIILFSVIAIFNTVFVYYLNNCICDLDITNDLAKAKLYFSYVISIVIVSIFLLIEIILFLSIIYNNDIDYYDRFIKYARPKFGKRIQCINNDEIKSIIEITSSCESQEELVRMINLIFKIMLEYNYSNITEIYDSMTAKTINVLQTFATSSGKNNKNDIAQNIFTQFVSVEASIDNKQKYKMYFFLISNLMKNNFDIYNCFDSLEKNVKNEVANLLVYIYLYLNGISEINDALTITIFKMIRNQIFTIKYCNVVFQAIREIFSYYEEFMKMDRDYIDHVFNLSDEYSFLYFVWQKIFCRSLEGE